MRLQLAERPYVPNLCQTPPQATLGFAPTAGGDSLRFFALTGAGPRHAQLLRWRWDFGDGTAFDGPAPPPHRYAPGAGAATAVRLTVTNNLGCAATAVAFPFALATAAQRALQAGFSVFPNPAGAAGATVQVPGLRPQGPVGGELRNALGQVVRREQWAPAALARGVSLGLSGLAPGVYSLRLLAREGTLVKRLLVQ
nr:PKD domain-containing protein [Hymenobacter sp. BT523]